MLTKSDLTQITTIVKTVVRDEVKELATKTELINVEKRLTKSINKVNKKVDLTIRLFDGDYIALKKRVGKLEDQAFA